MPSIRASLEFLADIPLYQHEKPYLVLLPAHEIHTLDSRLDNLEWETHDDVLVKDIREHWNALTIERCGFQAVRHQSMSLKFDTIPSLDAYRQETECLLRKKFRSSYVKCYDLKLRKNENFQPAAIDLNDPFLIEGPAKGAHNGMMTVNCESCFARLYKADVTFTSGPQIINRYLSEQEKSRYLKPNYRIRIINTWRTLVPGLEDRPLAFCDYRSIDPEDLVEADRVFPDRVGEVYYLRYCERQQWYWLEYQGLDELFLFTMYDTMAGHQAKYCPHVSFDNPRASSASTPRRSVETRSIIISKA